VVGGATREMGGARADRERGGRVEAGRNVDDGSGAAISAGSIVGTALAIGGSWGGADSAVGGTGTGATHAVVTSVMAEGMTLGTEGERNGMVTTAAGANDDAAGADGGWEGVMIPVLSDVAFFRSFLVGGAPVMNIAVATASMCCMCSSNCCLSSC
jgi:hypothetical protein